MPRFARSARLGVALAIAALPLAAYGLMPRAAAPEGPPVELAVGERRALLLEPFERARVDPHEIAEVTAIGFRTVVLTPRQAGAARLELFTDGHTRSLPLEVHPRNLSPLADEPPVIPDGVEPAPPPFTLSPQAEP